MHDCGSIPTSTTTSATRCSVATAGDVNPAAQCQISRSHHKELQPVWRRFRAEPDHALHDLSPVHALQLRLTCAGFFAPHTWMSMAPSTIVIAKLFGRGKLIIAET